jgi:hypothetical protein
MFCKSQQRNAGIFAKNRPWEIVEEFSLGPPISDRHEFEVDSSRVAAIREEFR